MARRGEEMSSSGKRQKIPELSEQRTEGELTTILSEAATIEELKTKFLEVMAANAAAMAAKDDELAAKAAAMAAKDDELAANAAAMAAKDDELAAKAAAMAAKLAAKDDELAAKDDELAAKDAVIASTDAISARDIIKTDMRLRDQSNSTAHTKTGYKVATMKKHVIRPFMPRKKFWDALSFRKTKLQIHGLNEATVVTVVQKMLESVIQSMVWAGYIPLTHRPEIGAQVDLGGPVTDLGIVSPPNAFLCAPIEVKKHVVSSLDEIYSERGPVAGQAFDQLLLCKLNHNDKDEDACFGLLTTFNSVKLVSTHPIRQDDIDRLECEDPENVNINSESVRTTKEMIDSRVFYATQEFTLGDSQATFEPKNKEYIQAIVTFVLLALQARKRGSREVAKLAGVGYVRTFSFQAEQRAGTVKFTNAEYPCGINMFRRPNHTHSLFDVWMQLGSGSRGVCCFATARRKEENKGGIEGCPCVLKVFYRVDENQQEVNNVALAEKERTNWCKVYKAETWDFCKVYQTQSLTVLVRPYFNTPDKAKQESLLGNRESPRQSAVWNGLERFAASGCKHNDLSWRHVGILPEDGEERVFLFDLGEVSELATTETDAWIGSSYEKLYKEWNDGPTGE
jgi:Family of unknown function (DUF5898)